MRNIITELRQRIQTWMQKFLQNLTNGKKLSKELFLTKKFILLVVSILCVLGFAKFISFPSDYPLNSVISIPVGESLTTITESLRVRHIISSSLLFRSTVIFLGGEKKVIAGDYLLNTRDSVFILAFRLIHGSFHLDPVKITIPEGWNVFQINDVLTKKITNFPHNEFLRLASSSEGYLFPDTYFFSPQATPTTIFHTMRTNFDAATLSLQPRITTFDHSLADVIIIASIVEAEAKTTESRRIVAGIMWKRLSLGMLLQVDSTFVYINGKNSYELTRKDLKINSPYNTYMYTGLPPTPINNPGLDSITATLSPIQTDYLYFFSGKDGLMYYAKTYAEHQKNIEKYGK